MDIYQQLRRDEGVRYRAYPDPLTGDAPWTIGVGHTGPEVHEGLTWNDAQVDAALNADVAKHDAELFEAVPWARLLDDARQGVLRNMCFNMGWPRLSGFKRMLAACKAQQWDDTAQQMLNSAWARQVGDRARRLSAQMQSGLWQ